MTDDYRVDSGAMAGEAVPSLADFAEEPGGAWPAGWYAADIIEGYATQRGKQMVTTDALSGNGTSRNLFVCLKITNKFGKVRNQRMNYNYRGEDFTPARLSMIKELREEFKGQRGAWPGHADAQRSSLAVGKIGQLEKAIGFPVRNGHGELLAGKLPGLKLAVRLVVTDEGYNDVTAVDRPGTHETGGAA
jgi:hypothetical protein